MLPSVFSGIFRQTAIIVLVLLLGTLALGTLAATSVRADEADDRFAVAAGYYHQQQWKLAVEEFQSFVRKHPQHSKANHGIFFLAEALLQLGRTEEAEVHFRQYLNREPDGRYARPSLFRAGEAAYLAGKAELAEADLQRYRSDYPDDKLNAYVFPYLGDLALGRGDAATAARHFRSGIERFPEGRLYDDCCFGLARALERLDLNKEATQLYQTVAAKQDAELADDAQFHLGALQYATGKCAQAVDTFAAFETKFIDSPWRTHARMGRGWALMKLDRPGEAKPLFQNMSSDPRMGVEAVYWLAMAQRAEEDWAAAAKTLLAAAAADPKHELISAIRFHAGDALRRIGNHTAACEQFDLVIASPKKGDEWIDDAMKGKIMASLSTEDYAAVDREADAFDQRFPQSPLKADVRRIHIRSLLKRKRHEEALKLLRPLVQDAVGDRQNLPDRWLLAQTYEGLGHYDEALAALAPVLKSADDRFKANAQLTQGSVLLALRRYAEAIEPLEAFLAAGPTGDAEVKGRGQLAICYARTGQLDKSKQEYAQLLQEYPTHDLIAPTTEQLAEAAYEAKDRKWSGRLFQWLRSEGGSGEYMLKGLHGVGWNLFNAGRLAEASTTFEKLLAKDPPPEMAAEAAWVRGRILDKLGSPEAALAMYNLVIDKYPQTRQHPQALLAAARLCDQLQQDQESLAHYERLTTEYSELPELDAVLYEWAWVLDDLDKKTQSNKLFEKLHKEHPQSPYWADATYRLARRALAAEDYARANELTADVLLRTADAAIREHTLYLRGRIAVAEGDWQRVGEAFAALLEEFPASPRRLAAEFWVAETAYRSGDYETAGRRFQRLAREIHGRQETWLAMIPLRCAQVEAQLKKWDRAYTIASTIEAEHPDFKQQYEADYLIGLCLADRADFQNAREAFLRVIRSPNGAKTETAAMAQWRIGETYFHQKNYEAAIREYLPVKILYAYPPWQALALLQAGKCHERLGELKEAAKLYGEIIELYPDTPSAEPAGQRLAELSETGTLPTGKTDSTQRQTEREPSVVGRVSNPSTNGDGPESRPALE